MAKVRTYKVTVLPGTPVADAIYYVKGASDTKHRVWVTSSAGVAREIDAITQAIFDAALLLKQDKFTGSPSQYVRGDGSLATFDKASIGLGNVDNTSDVNKPVSTATQTALNLKANDSAVVHTSGAESVNGIKSFGSSPVVPNASVANQAAAYGQVTSGDAALQTQIDTLNTVAASGLKYKGDINASTNPNYPAGAIGDTYIISTAGKIGGASGIDVEPGDMIIAKAATAAGNQATVGANWTIIQSNIGAATTTAPGYTAYATNAESIAGSISNKAVVPSGMKAAVDATAVKYDAAQSLTSPQQAQARTNIGAASSVDADWVATDW